MAKIDELHNYAYPDKYLDELHIYDKSKKADNSYDEIHNYGDRGITYGLDEMHLYGSYQTVETSEDETNTPKESQLIDIDEYFDEIDDMDEQQKEERKDLAKDFRDILMLILMLMLADLRVGNVINEGFYYSLAKSRMMKAVDDHLPNLDSSIYLRIEGYIDTNIRQIVESTVRNQEQPYFFSEERATSIAVDDAMATYNLDELGEAIKAGYKFKIWRAMNDNKVRPTHQEVDGDKVEIDKPFTVGRCLMQAPMIFDENSPFQDAKEIINCRCCLIYTNKGDKNTEAKKNAETIDNKPKNDIIDLIQIDPTVLAQHTAEELMKLLEEQGYMVIPLGHGTHKNQPYENGGGYRIHYGGNGLFSYHPPGGRHGGGAYYKLSNSEIGVHRYNLDGTEIIDE